MSLKDKIRKDFSNIQTSVDAYAKKADTYFQEMVMLSHKVNRHEKWLRQVAEKLEIIRLLIFLTFFFKFSI